MALSNIFNEPRREITESAIGIGLIGLLLGGDYFFASWLLTEVPLPVGMCIATVLAIGAVLLVRRGVYLRPRNRPHKDWQ